VIGLLAEVPVIPPGDEVAVKVEIAAPPVAAAVNGTEAVVPERVTVPIVGARDIVVAVIELEALELEESPTAFVALTTNVYAVSDCKPVTVSGEDAPVAL
jgi:hypothetical protein